MEYKELVNAYEELESTSKRLHKTYIISELLKKTSTDHVEKVVLLLRGRVFASGDSQELGISNKLLLKSISIVSGSNISDLENLWREIGDLGLVTEKVFSSKSQSTLFKQTLDVSFVFDTLRKLAITQGQGSTDQKVKLVSSLLSSAEPKEAKYIVRTVLQDLRVGVAEGTLRDAIAWAYLTNPNYDENAHSISPDREEYNKILEVLQSAIDKTNDYGLIVKLAKKGLAELEKVKMILGQPIKVMLAQRSSLTTAFSSVGKPAAFEYKLDGFRLQVQKDDDEVKLFTRRLEDVTKQFPDIEEVVKKNVKAKNCILDCEAAGFNPITKKYTPFQSISQRIKRKHEVHNLIKKLPIEINVFDILYLEGEEYINQPFSKRREKLSQIITQKERLIVLTKQIVTESEKEVEKFFQQSLNLGNEGLMAKSLSSTYKPGSRVGSMVKIKPHMDELDLVIVKAEWGTGKRSGWLTSFTVACGDRDSLFEIGKVGTGLKEKKEEGLSFEELTELLRPLISKQKGREIEVTPKIVVSLRFEEIQKSPSYSSGYALRFPRVIALREDKDLEDIATLKEVEDTYKQQ